MCIIHLTAVRGGIWLGLSASLGTPTSKSVLLILAPRRAEGRQGDSGQAEAPGLSFAHIWGGLHYLCSLGIRAVAYGYYYYYFYFINNYIL